MNGFNEILKLCICMIFVVQMYSTACTQTDETRPKYEIGTSGGLVKTIIKDDSNEFRNTSFGVNKLRYMYTDKNLGLYISRFFNENFYLNYGIGYIESYYETMPIKTPFEIVDFSVEKQFLTHAFHAGYKHFIRNFFVSFSTGLTLLHLTSSSVIENDYILLTYNEIGTAKINSFSINASVQFNAGLKIKRFSIMLSPHFVLPITTVSPGSKFSYRLLNISIGYSI